MQHAVKHLLCQEVHSQPFTDFKDWLLDGIRHMISERLSITLHIVGRSRCSCVRDGVGEGELFPE